MQTTPPLHSVLEVADLQMAYGAQTIVHGVSFTVHGGEIFGLLGPNGAGKTTTLSAIEGLQKPRAGTITVAGIDLQKDLRTAKANLGIQLQSTSFQEELNVGEIVRLYAGLYGVTLSNNQLSGVLRAANLLEHKHKRAGQLSGGQKQRLALCIATLHNPPLVLLDEPTTGLDPQSRRILWDHIEAMRSAGHAILLTTHSMEEAEAICDRIAIMDHGKILALDTPRNLVRTYQNNPTIRANAHGDVTLEDVFIGLTGKEVRT